LTDGQKQGYRSAQQFLTNDQEQPPTRETQMTVTEDRPTTVAGRREAARRDPASGYAATDTTITRLCDLSAGRSHEAYADIPWDDTGHELSPADPRLQLPEFEPIAQTAWYRGLPKHEKSVVGAWKMATMLRVGADFENLLQQGLLARSLSLPLGVPEFRYAHTEVSEESQHTMMFLEVVSRIGVPATGMPRYVVRALEAVIRTVARRDPALFFLGVLAGEDPIDRAQRRWLAAGVAHPTVERVLRIHVTEESRHVSYARVSVTRDVPKLGPVRRQLLAVTAPLVFSFLARMMFVPPTSMARAIGVDHDVLTGAYRTPYGREFLADSVGKSRKLANEVGLMTPLAKRIWNACGIGGPESATRRTRRATATA
jgi:hypothetical protein